MSVDIYVLGSRELRRRAPPVNWATTNARAVFALVGIPTPDYLVGELPQSMVADILRNVIGARNSRARRQPLDRVQVNVPSSFKSVAQASGARVIESGNTDEQTLRRLDQLQDLLVYAQKHQLPIGWS